MREPHPAERADRRAPLPFAERDEQFFQTPLIPPFGDFVPAAHLHQTGQSLVYEGFDSGVRSVAKVNYRWVQEAVRLMVQEGPSFGQAQKALRPEWEARLKRWSYNRAVLCDHFGPAVPDEEWRIRTITLPGATLSHILGPNCNGSTPAVDVDPNAFYDVETLVRTPRFDPIFEDPTDFAQPRDMQKLFGTISLRKRRSRLTWRITLRSPKR